MDYFAGLDISMDETHVCVLDREGVVVYESKSESTAAAIAIELSKAPSCRRIVFDPKLLGLGNFFQRHPRPPGHFNIE